MEKIKLNYLIFCQCFNNTFLLVSISGWIFCFLINRNEENLVFMCHSRSSRYLKLFEIVLNFFMQKGYYGILLFINWILFQAEENKEMVHSKVEITLVSQERKEG